MPRLSRAESQALTLQRLLASARELFRRDGYAATSVERIAEDAGYSKGAFYSNFDSKEAIFLAVLDAQGQQGLTPLLESITAAPSRDAIIDLLVDWSNDRSRSGSWSLTILEHARLSPGSPSLRQQEAIIRGHWWQLGACLLARFPGIAHRAEVLGALLHEIAYAPALTFISPPAAGDVMRLALAGLLRDEPQAAPVSPSGS